MTLWRWAALAGLGVAIFTVWFGQIPGIQACGVVAQPILAFEFVTSPADVAALFPESCRAVHVSAQRTGLLIDGLGFIPTYSAFLILSAAAMRGDGVPFARKTFLPVLTAVIVAALCDEFEGRQLWTLLATLPGDQSTIDLLMPAVRAKFALLALAALALGAMHWQAGGWRRITGAVAAAGSLWSLSGLLGDDGHVMGGSSLAFLALIVTSWVLAMRKTLSTQANGD